METMLIAFVLVIGIIVVTSIINEKKLHIQKDVALVLVSFIISVLVIIFQKICYGSFDSSLEVLKNIQIGGFGLECILSFMLFANASRVHISKFMNNVKPIAYLSLMTTVISSVIYGLIFYGINMILNLNLGVWICMLLGCLLSPTDPIAITSTLKKIGASKSLLSVIEGEALFNDGVGVILFIFVSSVIKLGNVGNLAFVLFKEIFGAIVVGLIISWLFFKLIKMTNEPLTHILISLLTVALSLVVCDVLGVSGDIAAVVSGIYFAYQNQKISRWKEVVDSKELYNDFWNIAANLLNSIFFVLIGISILYIDFNVYAILLIPFAVVLSFLSRLIGVGVSTVLIGKKKIPRKYNFKEFSLLMTCSGSRGMLSLALALSSKAFLAETTYMTVFTVTIITLLFTTIIQELIAKKVYTYIERKRDERALKVI